MSFIVVADGQVKIFTSGSCFLNDDFLHNRQPRPSLLIWVSADNNWTSAQRFSCISVEDHRKVHRLIFAMTWHFVKAADIVAAGRIRSSEKKFYVCVILFTPAFYDDTNMMLWDSLSTTASCQPRGSSCSAQHNNEVLAGHGGNNLEDTLYWDTVHIIFEDAQFR